MLTVEIICHGTPSPLLWENYIEYIARGHDIAHVNFRSKRFGWTNNHLEINFFDCGFYAKSNGSDLYLKNFLQSMTERPSCHECKFKFPNGKADITIGDAWGVQIFAPEFFDNRGTSLVIVHTANGRNFLSKAKLIKQAVNFDVVPMFNPHALTSSIPDTNRQNFFDDLKNFPHLSVAVMQKYFHQNPNKIDISNRTLIAESVQKYSAILKYFATLREKNLMFITPPINDDTLSKIPRDKDSGFYILQMTAKNQAILIDGLHPFIRFTISTNFENLREIIKSFHITEILLDEQINFNAEGIKFLESCGAKVEKLKLK